MKGHTPITDRITRLQQAHPWLLEREARHLLVAGYAALTNGMGLQGEILQTELEGFTEGLTASSREEVEAYLSATGGLAQ